MQSLAEQPSWAQAFISWWIHKLLLRRRHKETHLHKVFLPLNVFSSYLWSTGSGISPPLLTPWADSGDKAIKLPAALLVSVTLTGATDHLVQLYHLLRTQAVYSPNGCHLHLFPIFLTLFFSEATATSLVSRLGALRCSMMQHQSSLASLDLKVKTKTTHGMYQSYTLDFAILGCSRTKLSETEEETGVVLFVGLQVQNMTCPSQSLL